MFYTRFGRHVNAIDNTNCSVRLLGNAAYIRDTRCYPTLLHLPHLFIMATNNLVDITKLSPKFQDLYAKAKDFVEVYRCESLPIHLDTHVSNVE